MQIMKLDTPIGNLTLTATKRGLKSIQFGLIEEEHSDDGNSDTVTARQHLKAASSQLREYFRGDRRDFDLELDPEPGSDWTCSVISLLRMVDYGRTTTYGELAKRASGGKSGHRARAIGSVMRNNTLPIIWPCHRVIGSDGSLTGYAGGLEAKNWLLRLERAHA